MAVAVLVNAKPAAVVVLGNSSHVAPAPARDSQWIEADHFFGGIEAFEYLHAQGNVPLYLRRRLMNRRTGSIYRRG